ncbi:MAG: hypothetical protein IJ060_09030 [Oscillospiraceae bacterium]|nr:hypothetical protein [Oscillospiraceae bacterium]
MKTVNVYEQYFRGECSFADVPRHGAQVRLTAESDAGQIRYTVSVNFFPHSDPEDFGITYDAYCETTLYEAAGRRSGKREKAFLEGLRESAEALAGELGGTVFWDEPLIEARYG